MTSNTSTAGDASELLSVAEVAVRLRVDESTVRRFVRDGRLPAVRVGGQWRIGAAAVRVLVDIGKHDMTSRSTVNLNTKESE